MSDIDLRYKTELLKYTLEDVDAILATFGRNTQSVKGDVKVVKDWLNCQPHLPHPHPSEKQLISILIRNKFSIEKTKEKLDNSYTIKTLIPEYYKDKLPSNPDILKVMDIYTIVALPKLTPDLNRVNMCYVAKDSPDEFNVVDCFSSCCIFLEIKSILDVSYSDIYVCDLSKASTKFVLKFGLMEVKKILTVLEKVYSNRIKALHFVRLTPIVVKFLELMTPLFPKKLRDRFYYHVDYESLYKVLPREMFPKEFGGEEKSLDVIRDEWKDLYVKFADHFRVVQNVVVDEKLRPKKLENDDVLGYHGNFRKLDVD